MEPFIKARKAGYSYRGLETTLPALRHINLEVFPGEHVALLGPNGSGKSTLLKLFNALLLPTSGEVFVGGKSTIEADGVWDIRQHCSMVFQNPDNQLVATTVEEDVAFGLENLQVSPANIRERVDEALEIMDLKPWAQHAPHLLSGGQKQRVALAGVMAMRPRCLLLDEPTAQLDLMGKKEVMKALLKLHQQEGLALINVTHFLEEASLAQRVVVLQDGCLVRNGPAEEVLSEIENLYQWGLEPPPAVNMAKRCADRGVPLQRYPVTIEQLVDELCSLK